MVVPDENPCKPGFSEEDAGEHDPVHEPWLEQGGVGGIEGFVGGEDGEEECCNGSMQLLSALFSLLSSLFSLLSPLFSQYSLIQTAIVIMADGVSRIRLRGNSR